MSVLADLLSTLFERRHLGFSVGRDDGRAIETLTAALMGTTSEVSGQAVAQRILDRYSNMDDAARLDFFRHLALDLAISPDAVQHALDAYQRGETKASYQAFMSAIEPPRQELVRRLNQAPDATAALVGMRSDLLRLGRDEDALQALDLDFQHLFASWFNRGFLDMIFLFLLFIFINGLQIDY